MATARARWIYWHDVNDGDRRLKELAASYRDRITDQVGEFRTQIKMINRLRKEQGQVSLLRLHRQICDGLRYQRSFPEELRSKRSELIGATRRRWPRSGSPCSSPTSSFSTNSNGSRHCWTLRRPIGVPSWHNNCLATWTERRGEGPDRCCFQLRHTRCTRKQGRAKITSATSSLPAAFFLVMTTRW